MKKAPLASPKSRRKPTQARAAARQEKFLDVAARLIVQSGYEAVTMTAIAAEAKASIGTLYDYFPDKLSLALSLQARYTAEADEHWQSLLVSKPVRSKARLADIFVEGILDFVRKRPAYLALLDAPLMFKRTESARKPLRATFAAALEAVHPGISPDQALLAAHIIVALLKSFLGVYRRSSAAEKPQVEAAFRRILKSYLSDQLKSGAK